jgi:hypothetical protein
MADRLALAHTAPWAISVDSSSILSRNVARMIGTSLATARTPSTYSRVSDSGMPTFTPRRSCTGPWLTPRPSENRPPDTSWMCAAMFPVSAGWAR